MITTHAQRTRPLCRRGFTLVETMVSAGVIGIVSGAMLATTVFLSKTARNISNHVNIASEARIALEYISRDLLAAIDVTTAGGTNVRVTVEQPDGESYDVQYRRRGSATDYRLDRRVRSGGSWTSWETLLDDDVLKDLKFFYYNSEDATVNNSKKDDVKKVNVRLELESAVNTGYTELTQSDVIYSARFVLRNRATP